MWNVAFAFKDVFYVLWNLVATCWTSSVFYFILGYTGSLYELGTYLCVFICINIKQIFSEGVSMYLHWYINVILGILAGGGGGI